MSQSDVNGPSWTQKHDPLWHHDIGLMAGVWLFMAATLAAGGAYDTDEFSGFHRLVFWLIVSALLVFQPVLLDRAFSRFTPASTMGAWISAIGAVFVAIFITAVQLQLLKYTPLLPRAVDPWIEFIPFVSLPVVIVASFVLFLRFAWERRHLDPPEALASPASPLTNPGTIGPDTLYVRSQDHYLEIVTDHGQRFIRGRLADIGTDNEQWGFSPHRSWWVSDRAVYHCKRKGRDLQLNLSDGTQVPVSRSRQDTVRQRGHY